MMADSSPNRCSVQGGGGSGRLRPLPTLQKHEADSMWTSLVLASDRGSRAWCKRLQAWVERGGAMQRWGEPQQAMAAFFGVPLERVQDWLSRR